MKLAIAFLAAVVLGLAGPALGATDAHSGIDLGEAFKKADIDGDSKVSKAEATGNERLVVGFDKADRNHDGKLSRAEFDSVYKRKPAKKARRVASRPSASRGASSHGASSR